MFDKRSALDPVVCVTLVPLGRISCLLYASLDFGDMLVDPGAGIIAGRDGFGREHVRELIDQWSHNV